MREDGWGGYIVKGYYGDEEMRDNGEGLKRIGKMKEVKEIMCCRMNDRMNGEGWNIEEVLWWVWDKDGEMMKMIELCDKNVIEL